MLGRIRPLVIPRRDPGVYEPVLWLRAIKEPPPFLDGDDWELIEHIRTAGQLSSGAILGNDHYFERPVFEQSSVNILDRHAAERRDAEIRAHDKARQERVAEYRKEMAEEIAKWRKQHEKQEKEREERKQEQREQERLVRELDLEHQRLLDERYYEQRRRDEEWEQTARQNRVALQRDWEESDRHKRDAEWEKIVRKAKAREPGRWPHVMLPNYGTPGPAVGAWDMGLVLINEIEGVYRDKPGETYWAEAHADGTFDLFRISDGRKI